MICGILEDESGFLWVSTNHGLSRFDPENETFLCFIMPSLNRFAYKLEPRDREWISLGQTNTVTVSHLKPEDYRLHVKGSNPDGVWNENGFEIGIELVPPFWRTPWFAILALLFVASGVATVVRNHIYNIYQKLGVKSRLELINRIGKDAQKKA